MRRFRVAIIEPSAIIAEGVATLAGRSGEFDNEDAYYHGL